MTDSAMPETIYAWTDDEDGTLWIANPDMVRLAGAHIDGGKYHADHVLTAKDKRIAELEAALALKKELVEALGDENLKFQIQAVGMNEQLKTMAGALEFYANPATYEGQIDDYGPFHYDKDADGNYGEKARDALKSYAEDPDA